MMKIKVISFVIMIVVSMSVVGKELTLPKIKAKAGMDVMQAIETNAASRSFTAKKVSMEAISTILWMGYGMVLEKGKKTVHGYDAVTGATQKERYSIAHGWGRPYMNVYLVLKEGTYKYQSRGHKLKLVSEKNLMGNIGGNASNAQGYIVITTEYDKMPMKGDVAKNVAYLSAGSIVQNMHIGGAVHNVQFLTEVYIQTDAIKKAFKLQGKEESVIVLSFGHSE